MPDADPAAEREVVEAFLAAAREGDFDALVAVLDPDVVHRVDTGSGAIVETRGAELVARRALVGAGSGRVARLALVNGATGFVALQDGELFAIAALTVQNGRIAELDILADPARLARIDLGSFSSGR
jgi:RNA polymerase sigma-70 factor (ECF subfamily)